MEQNLQSPSCAEPTDRTEAPVVAVVEDSPIFRKFVSLALETMGCIPIEAASVHAADDVLARRDVRLVILDWNLEGNPAAPLLQQILAAGIPALVVTGDPESVEDIPCPVLGKPVHFESLKSAVHEILGIQ